MDDTAQFERIFDELESIRAQLRSMQESISSNTGLMMQEITGLKTWRDGHERRIDDIVDQRDKRDAAVDAEIRSIALDLGVHAGRLEASIQKESGRIDDLDRTREHGRGIVIAWRIAVAIFAAAAGVYEFLAHRGGH